MTYTSKRNSELLGLILVGTILIVGMILTTSFQQARLVVPTPTVWATAFSFLPLAVVIRFRAKNANALILPVAAFLSILGLIELRALKSSYLQNQQIWILLGLIATALVVMIIREPERLGEFKYLAGAAGVILLFAPMAFGAVRGGSKLWLIVGRYSFQPAELAKVFLIIFLAAYLAEKKEVLAEARHFGPLLTTWVVSLAVLVLERDLGSSLIFFSLFLVMLYTATGRPAFVGAGIILFMGGAWAAYHIFDHVAARIDVWLHPLPSNVGGSAYQVAQSLFALSGGGIFGTGLGAGLLGRQIAMPAVHTDFIFSALGEELGLAGAVIIVLAYMLFAAAGWSIAAGAKTDFSKLLAVGLTTITTIQAAVIIGGVLKLIPLTGVTLPFVSYGGSSILSNYVIVGLLLSVSNNYG